MTTFLESHVTVDDAYVAILEAANATGRGTLFHSVITVASPSTAPRPEVIERVNAQLALAGSQEIGTVANTLFPIALYTPPGFVWSAGLPAERVAELDAAAEDFYSAYLASYPLIKKHSDNERGTYFGRMILWPTAPADKANQLARRIKHIRGKKNFHAADITLGGEGDPNLPGIQIYAATDTRTRAFPCLVHLGLTVEGGKISMSAHYRNWHLITKAYGNLVGLSRLLQFLADQTGLKVGELMIVAGGADVERATYGKLAGLQQFVADLQEILDPNLAAA
jgi:hypothetical protein